MDAPSPPGPAQPTPPDFVLRREQACVKCGYQLKGLPLDGVCPECGTRVQDSLKGFLLQYASAEYRQRVGKGLSFILNAILLSIVLGLIGVLAGLLQLGAAVTGVVAIANFGVTLMSIAGYFWYTEPDPGYTGIEKPNSARQIARTAVLVLAGVQLVQAVMAMGSMASAGPGSLAAAGALAILFGLLSLAASVTQFFAVMLYTQWMGGRVPDALLQRRAKTYMWLLPLISVVGLLIIIGPLIALILYWNLLDRLRKHVKSINAAGHPARLDNMYA